MKVIVIGSGVIGVTTAYFLALEGCSVEVIDRQQGPALETSFANAGQVSPGYSSPWAAPGIPSKAIKWLMMRHAPLIVRPTLDPFQYRWMLQMLRNCTAPRYAVNKSRMVRLAEYSRDVLDTLRDETGISYDAGMRGTLQLFRKQSQLDAVGKDIAVLKDYGVAHEVLDKAGCIAAEPGLAGSQASIAGGLRLPGDETGDCFAFTNALAALCEASGVVFHYGTSVSSFITDAGAVTGVKTDKGVFNADRVVLAGGSYSRALAKPLGIDLPVYPVKGYSITTPVQDEGAAPVSTILDETYKIALTRLGSRIRVGGMAQLSGYDTTLEPARRETLAMCVDDLFPGAADTANASFWTGLRPMTPDGTPVIGPTRLGNLFVNTGHGTLGWTMACGSARVLANLLAGQPSEIETDDLGISRYQRAA